MAVTDSEDLQVDDIDVLSDLDETDGPPHGAFGWLRANRPLHRQLDRAIPQIELAGPAEHVWSSSINGIKHLTVRTVRA